MGTKSQTKSGILHFSKRVDYGLLILGELVKEPASLRNIAERNGISFYFLQRVAADLRKANLIEAARGQGGGYKLAKASGHISLKQIIEAIEGPMYVMPCIGHGKSCSNASKCSVRSGLGMVNNLIVDAFEHVNLDNLVNPY